METKHLAARHAPGEGLGGRAGAGGGRGDASLLGNDHCSTSINLCQARASTLPPPTPAHPHPHSAGRPNQSLTAPSASSCKRSAASNQGAVASPDRHIQPNSAPFLGCCTHDYSSALKSGTERPDGARGTNKQTNEHGRTPQSVRYHPNSFETRGRGVRWGGTFAQPVVQVEGSWMAACAIERALMRSNRPPSAQPGVISSQGSGQGVSPPDGSRNGPSFLIPTLFEPKYPPS